MIKIIVKEKMEQSVYPFIEYESLRFSPVESGFFRSGPRSLLAFCLLKDFCKKSVFFFDITTGKC